MTFSEAQAWRSPWRAFAAKITVHRTIGLKMMVLMPKCHLAKEGLQPQRLLGSDAAWAPAYAGVSGRPVERGATQGVSPADAPGEQKTRP